MATFQAIFEFDLRELNFGDMRDASYGARLVEDNNGTLLGKTYKDVYAYYWEAQEFETHVTAYFGRDMSINALSDVVSGRIEVIGDTVSAAGTLLDNWYMVGIDIAARDLTAAGRTASTADDKRVIADIFKGNDSILLSYGNDYIDGHNGNDFIRGGLGNDSLTGGTGNDRVLAQGGDDRLYLDSGNDRIDGGVGRDWLVATGAGKITVDLARTDPQGTGRGLDVLRGIESVKASSGNDRISGSGTGNELQGLGGDDWLNGRAGNDTLRGGNGEDTLSGGSDRDVLIGGSGADVFVFGSLDDVAASGGQADKISDFTQGRDRIRLSGIDANEDAAGNNVFRFGGKVTDSAVAEGRVVFRQFDLAGDRNDFTAVLFGTDDDTAAEGVIRLSGLIDLTANDFLL